MAEIVCPKLKLVDLIEALYEPDGFFSSVAKAENQDVAQELTEIFPNLPKAQLERLAREVRIENLKNRNTLLKLRKYAQLGDTGNLLMDSSYGLARHVERCRGQGKCLDKYALWLHEKAESIRFDKCYDEETVPGLIRRLDFRILDLGVF